MTTLHEINGHSVDVPDDMSVHRNFGISGASYIMYRGVMIFTMDEAIIAGHAYEAGFIVDLPSKIEDVSVLQDVKSLKEARELIDEISKPKLPLPPKNVPDIMTLTIAQAKAVYKKWMMMEKDQPSFGDFLDTVQATIGCDGAVTVKWCGMWLCIEKDGYTHS